MTNNYTKFFEQCLYMYSDYKLKRYCNKQIKANLPDELLIVELNKTFNKNNGRFTNPELLRIVKAINNNRWDDVFY